MMTEYRIRGWVMDILGDMAAMGVGNSPFAERKEEASSGGGDTRLEEFPP
jgi:hypothetical protein